MAYTQKPGSPTQQKTGHGIPAAFRQDAGSPVQQLETIKNAFNAGKKIVSNIGDRISSANDAGQEAYDNSRKSTAYLGDFGGGSGGRKDDYTKDPTKYIGAFVNNLVSGNNPKTKEPKKAAPRQMKPNSPAKQTKKAKAAAKPVEKGFLDTATDFVKSAGNKVYEGAQYLSEMADGKHGSKDYNESDEDMRIKNLPSVKNKKTNETKNAAPKQMKPKTSMAKMKKC